MRKTALHSLSLDNFIRSGRTIIEEFNPKKFVFIDSLGQWKEDPKTIEECISNEFLYHIWKLEDDKQASFIHNIFYIFKKHDSWLMAKKIKLALGEDSKSSLSSLTNDEIDRDINNSYSRSSRSKRSYPFLIILEVLGWILKYEAIKLNCELLVPEWNLMAKTQQQKYRKHLESLDKFLNELFIEKKGQKLILDTVSQLNKKSPESIKAILQVIAEEDRLIKTINRIREEAKDTRRKEEVFSFIVEKIHPPMGVVTNTSAALLRSCLKLLMDDNIEIESGIQYNASVILSILQDTRATETLLKTFERFPLYYSKIRENIIYTLGKSREKNALKFIANVLEEPDKLFYSSRSGERKFCLLIEQKEEAILALGRIGLESLKFLPVLVKYAEHPSAKIQTCLAWALGEIGKTQKEKFGGVSADIIITLLKLLKIKNKQVFEESVNSLKKIDMPEFIHSLYLYYVGAVSILGLKPAQKGLYELSETLHFLIRTKKRAIVAIGGDSGTGKTYFCGSIIQGFGEIKPEEILYLMRDRRKDQKILNQILGLEWLKKNVDPIYYHDYPLTEGKDNPEAFLSQFLKKNSDKKLIILDGCRDQNYFQKVIDLFHIKGALDIVVNFRTPFSTRRLNLEEREIALESVRTHLSFIEEPPFEDTQFYQEGKVLVYDLDNSIGSRLNSEEIKELFERKKIDNWGDLIRIGNFKGRANTLKIGLEKYNFREENFSVKNEKLPNISFKPFLYEERKFKAQLNENLAEQPNLLQTIEMQDLKPSQICHYAQEQIAGIGEGGSVFVLTFLDNRIFYTFTEKNASISLQSRDILLIDEKGQLTDISFERNEIANIANTESPALVLTSISGNKIITGHRDGTIRIWDLLNRDIQILEGHRHPVISLSVDYSGRIFTGSSDNVLKQWDMKNRKVKVMRNLDSQISFIKLYTLGRLLVLTESKKTSQTPREELSSKMIIIDFEKEISQVINLPFNQLISSIDVYFDGRIIAGFLNSKKNTVPRLGSLAVISPQKNSWKYKALNGHEVDTKDCLAIGPKIITCGIDGKSEHTIRLWGTESYVRLALSKLYMEPSRLY